MPAIDDLTAIRQLLDVPHPTDDVTAAGQVRLDELTQQEASRQRPSRTGRGATTLRSRRIGIFATATIVVAAATAAATALVLTHPGSARPSAAQHADTHQTGATSTAPGSVQQAILTAIGAAGGDIMHLTVSTSGGPSVARGVVQYWWWPAKPVPGQQVHLLTVDNGGRTAVTFTEPASSSDSFLLQPIPASGLAVDPASKTWRPISQYTYGGVVAETSRNLLDESYMRATYLAHGKVINGHAAIDGHIAIEISVPAIPTPHVLLWVDTQTYLPLRQVKLGSGVTNYPETRKVYDYQFLPATPANLATLTLTVPRGYTKVSS
jgi:hypothetical protein